MERAKYFPKFKVVGAVAVLAFNPVQSAWYNKKISFYLVFTDYVGIPQTPLTRHCANTSGLRPCMLSVRIFI